jgi:hypothetical protein
MRDDTQLNQKEGYQIEAFLQAGHPQSGIATVLKRDKSTISREVRRNCGLRGYAPSRRSVWLWPTARPRLSRGLRPALGSGLRACRARSGVRSRSAAGCRGSRDCMSVTNGSTSLFMQTSARAATFIPTGVARSGAGSTTGVMTAGPDQGSGCNRRAAGDC